MSNATSNDTNNGTAEPAGGSETPVTESARKLAHEAIDAAGQKAGDIERRLRQESDRIGSKVGEGSREVGEQLDETLALVEDYIRKRPVAAAGMAFAAGVLATMILRR